MKINRRTAIATGLASSLAGPSFAVSFDARAHMDALIFAGPISFSDAVKAIENRRNPDMAAALIQAMRFSRMPVERLDQALRVVTGSDFKGDWFEWMLWQEANPQIKPHPDFIDFKRELFSRIDPNFLDFLRSEYLSPEKMKIRLEEITWGGVLKDGIPSLDNPEMLHAFDASYLKASDLVFGVKINGDARAYPLRIMGWHEMFNDVIGGVPVALAYCTLCGSGILFETHTKGLKDPLIFGSSGFLYRSNKLMFDRKTNSLWNQFTGKPVVGPLVEKDIELKQRPVVITSWDAWRKQNPDTKVLSLKTGHSRDYGSGVVYNDYFGSPDLMFPALVDQRTHQQKDYVFGIREFGQNKAWPLSEFVSAKIWNDQIGNRNIVLIGEPETRSVRAYERENYVFDENSDSPIIDGQSWKVTEDALIGPDGTELSRVAGHIAYWFAWDNYLGLKSEVASR